MRTLLFTFASLTLSLSTVSTAAAQPQTQGNGAYDHDSGFFMRLALGAGYHSTTTKVAGLGDIGLSGVGGNASFAFGGIIARNLALHATLFVTSALDPKLEVNGAEFNTDDTRMTTAGLGVGVTYYLMPANIYLGASVGPAFATLRIDGQDGDSDVGFGATAVIGKEWWVGRKWGLGLAGQFIFANVSTERGNDVKTVGFGVLLSASFN